LVTPSDASAAPRGSSLRRRAVALVAWLVPTLAAAPISAQMLDTLVAVVDSKTVAASDVALARALGAFGFAPSGGPLTRADVARYVDVVLVLRESEQIGISAEPAEIDLAWAAVVARAGGEAAAQRWLDEHAIDRAWARRVVQLDVQRTKFFQERFAAFVVPTEDEIARALGPGQHDETAREQARERLAGAAAEKAQAEWLAAARRRATIRILIADGAAIPPLFPPP
jgi:hypothetical protein